MGDLGKHTYIFEGFPIYTAQTRVFQQVGCGTLSRRFTMRLMEVQILYAVLITTVLTFGFTKLAILLFYKRYETFIDCLIEILMLLQNISRGAIQSCLLDHDRLRVPLDSWIPVCGHVPMHPNLCELDRLG